MKGKYIIFDLDDTLMYEIDYLESAYYEIAHLLDPNDQDNLYQDMMRDYHENKDVFGMLEERYSHNKVKLLDMYRNHFPMIKMGDDVRDVLNYISQNNYKLGLISDGRSITQRNKLKALDIEDLFDKIIISEEFGSMKPDHKNFETFMDDKNFEYFYIGDNTKKDFVTPNKLGWTTIALKDAGRNIHKQDFDWSPEHKPQFIVNNLKEIINYIN
ncbi:HAD family hydrolase [Chryseobacterium sp. c4a]|uniref:HAD family hydrolase n=1 Tax=Chryseobacterium sp. c4a TaxID=1573582 RepID=UPI00135A8937|nr:HAD family hydrolase [Chryseobacterium sp. c4a]